MTHAHRRHFVGLLALVALALAGSAQAATTYNVTNPADGGNGSLRDAIDQANNGGGGTIFIRSSTGQEIHLFENLPTVTTSLTIVGNGVTITGNGGYRAMMVGNGAADATVTLDGVQFGANAVVFVNPMGHVVTRSQPVPTPAPLPHFEPAPLQMATATPPPVSKSMLPVAENSAAVFAAKTQRTSFTVDPITSTTAAASTTDVTALKTATPIAKAVPIELKPTPPPVWVAHRDAWLSDTIAEWSKKAGWQEPVWKLADANGAKVDYRIPSEDPIPGKVEDAAAALFKAYIDADADHPMDVKILPDQKLIVVTNAKASQ